jgi:hypothetical protein
MKEHVSEDENSILVPPKRKVSRRVTRGLQHLEARHDISLPQRARHGMWRSGQLLYRPGQDGGAMRENRREIAGLEGHPIPLSTKQGNSKLQTYAVTSALVIRVTMGYDVSRRGVAS